MGAEVDGRWAVGEIKQGLVKGRPLYQTMRDGENLASVCTSAEVNELVGERFLLL